MSEENFFLRGHCVVRLDKRTPVPGEVFNGEYTITNQGLIAVDYMGLNFPATVSDYDIEVLSSFPVKLNAMQKITIPYRVKRRAQ